jgi:antibiotic biosynthesis monooxygenase (ABM) superfamily enzyme
MATAARQVEQPAGWDMQEPDSSSESGGLLPPTDSGGGGPPVTVTIQQRVGRAQVDAFLKWEQGITAANEQFDGFVSTTVLREPIGPQGEGEGQGDQLFVTIIKYVDFASARRWNQSEERKAWLDKLEQVRKRLCREAI